jgi:Arc/MetJ-type ribon-helix-helix transcriptional regulator
MPRQFKWQGGFYAGSKIPQAMKKSICKVVQSGSYLNESDFIRHAIKEKLEKECLLQTEQRVGGSPVQSTAFVNTKTGSETNLGHE